MLVQQTKREVSVELIFIGDKFYSESKSIMSSIYTVDAERSDWGFVQVALRNGESVHIRPATKIEMVGFVKLLDKIKAEQA